MKDQLARRIRIRDKQVLVFLFRKYDSLFWGYAKRYFNDSEQTREIVQEAFKRIAIRNNVTCEIMSCVLLELNNNPIFRNESGENVMQMIW